MSTQLPQVIPCISNHKWDKLDIFVIEMQPQLLLGVQPQADPQEQFPFAISIIKVTKTLLLLLISFDNFTYFRYVLLQITQQAVISTFLQPKII